MEVKIMAQIKFNHKKEMVSEALGVTEKRWDEIIDAVKEARSNKKLSKTSEKVEYVVKKAKIVEPMEFVLVGMTVERVMSSKVSELSGDIVKMLLLTSLLK